METFSSRRKFQLWSYTVSHGCALIRSPRDERFSTNLDLACWGVEYLCAPRFIDGLSIVRASQEDLAACSPYVKRSLLPADLLVFETQGVRCRIVMATYRMSENEEDIFFDPFTGG
jgi:hypothetical protein